MSDILYKIAITKIPGIGAVTAKQLIAWCGGVKNVFQASKKDLLNIPGIGQATVKNIQNQEYLQEAKEELIFIQENNIQTLFYLDDNYPKRLTHFNDAPILLYYKGNADLNHPRIVGIVGTRKPTEWGKSYCEKLVEELKAYDVLVISGLAYGVDITAHKKSVEMEIPTIGCLGHGLHMIYPAKHKSVAKKMLTNGGLLTEFTSKQKPDAPHFPMRNRIIAGMSDALIVIETARRGGSMITAEIANHYNKDVFAVPGRISDPNSEGCNLLIKSHKAQLMDSARDIGFIMRWEKEGKKKQGQQRELFIELSEDENKIMETLHQKESEAVDAISYETGFPQSQLAGLLLNLEFKGVIKSLPGKRYMIV